jgi:hypothetical protein
MFAYWRGLLLHEFACNDKAVFSYQKNGLIFLTAIVRRPVAFLFATTGVVAFQTFLQAITTSIMDREAFAWDTVRREVEIHQNALPCCYRSFRLAGFPKTLYTAGMRFENERTTFLKNGLSRRLPSHDGCLTVFSINFMQW